MSTLNDSTLRGLVLLHLHARRPNGVLLTAIEEVLRDFASAAETRGLVTWLAQSGLLRTAESIVSDRKILAVYLTPKGHDVLNGETWPGVILPPRRETGRAANPVVFVLLINDSPNLSVPTPHPRAEKPAPKSTPPSASISAPVPPQVKTWKSVRVDAGAGITAELRWSHGWVIVTRFDPQGKQVGKQGKGPWTVSTVRHAPAWVREAVASAVSTGQCPPFTAAPSSTTTPR